LGSSDRRVKVPFEEWELEALHEVARKRGASLTQVVREAVRRMLEQEREREAIERMEAVMEEYMLRTTRTIEPLKDEVGLLGSGLKEVKAELQEVKEKLSTVARLEEAIELLRKELSDLREKVSMVELSARDVWRRGESALARREPEAGYGQLHREAEMDAVGPDVAANHGAGFQIPSFIKDNPWVEILSRKGRS
jgi:DNA repair exonuclease SbcCD ATPase subunit